MTPPPATPFVGGVSMAPSAVAAPQAWEAPATPPVPPAYDEAISPGFPPAATPPAAYGAPGFAHLSADVVTPPPGVPPRSYAPTMHFAPPADEVSPGSHGPAVQLPPGAYGQTMQLPPASSYMPGQPAHATPPGGAPQWQGSNGRPAVTMQFPDARQTRSTARVSLRSGGAWRPVVVALSALLIAAAWVVHTRVVPLEVLATWSKPASLYVASEPEGASLKLDGVVLPYPAPAKADVRRDRADHVLEVSRPGYLPAKETIRYDRSVVLSFMVRLQKDPAAPAGAKTAAAAAAPPDTLQGGRKQ